jgi:hypothetical protein
VRADQPFDFADTATTLEQFFFVLQLELQPFNPSRPAPQVILNDRQFPTIFMKAPEFKR